MKHLKKFNKTFEGIREEGGDIYIDGMSDENHVLYPMIEELNDALRETDLNKACDIISSAMNKCYDIQYQYRYKKENNKRTLTKDELDQSQALANSLSNLLDNVEYEEEFDDFDNFDEDNDDFENDPWNNRRENLLNKDKLDEIIHDIVVNGKLWHSPRNQRDGW